MKQHIRYGNKNADGTVTWGDWQTVELSQTVGNDTTLIYIDNGEIKASTATVGSAAQPVYLNGGTVTACNSTVGSGTKPIYSNSGTLTASSSTVGSAAQPVYLNGGTVTACSDIVAVSGQLFARSGYIKFTNGLIIQWGQATSNTLTTFPISFSGELTYATTLTYAMGSEDGGVAYQSVYQEDGSSFYIKLSASASAGIFYLAIGY